MIKADPSRLIPWNLAANLYLTIVDLDCMSNGDRFTQFWWKMTFIDIYSALRCLCIFATISQQAIYTCQKSKFYFWLIEGCSLRYFHNISKYIYQQRFLCMFTWTKLGFSFMDLNIRRMLYAHQAVNICKKQTKAFKTFIKYWRLSFHCWFKFERKKHYSLNFKCSVLQRSQFYQCDSSNIGLFPSVKV